MHTSDGRFKTTYDANIILLSVGVAFLGSYITICLCEQYRLSIVCKHQPKFLSQHGFLWAMAISLGGIGIWCMHFIGMSAMKLEDGDGERVDIDYLVFPTIISLVCSMLLAFAGLWYASHDNMFGKTKEEIVELYKDIAMRGTIGQIRRTTFLRMIFIITTQSPQHLLCGGFIAGLGVSVMHYLGMWGMRFKGGDIHWDIGCVAGSVIFAVVAATAAFWILFRLLSVYPHLEVLRVLSALIMAVAVNGMHYTGMVAADFRYHEYKEESTQIPSMDAAIDGDVAFYVGLIVAVVLGVSLIMVSFAELRSVVYSQGSDLKSHEQFVAFLQSDERYTAYVKKWFPTFAHQKSLTTMIQGSVTDKPRGKWMARSAAFGKSFAGAVTSTRTPQTQSARVAAEAPLAETEPHTTVASPSNAAEQQQQQQQRPQRSVHLFLSDFSSEDSEDDSRRDRALMMV